MASGRADSRGKGTADAAGSSASSVECSICLDMVLDDGERSMANLQCGHRFHLDCIGSAFNAKGLMQCPNCRKKLKGKWVYGQPSESSLQNVNSPSSVWVYGQPSESSLQNVNSPSSAERSLHDRMYSLFSLLNNEDLYAINYRGMVYGSPSNLYHGEERYSIFEGGRSVSAQGFNMSQLQTVLAGHPAYSSVTPFCPCGYALQLPSFSCWISTDNMVNYATTNNLFGSNSVSLFHTSPVDLHIHERNCQSFPHSLTGSHVTGAQQRHSGSLVTPTTQSEDLSRSEHSFITMHRSGHAGSDSSTRSNESSQAANSQIHSSHPHFITSDSEQAISSASQSSSSLVSTRLESTLSEYAEAFYPSPSTERGDRDSEVSGGSCFYAWERDQFAPFPLRPVDGNLSWGGPTPTSQISDGTGTSHPT